MDKIAKKMKRLLFLLLVLGIVVALSEKSNAAISFDLSILYKEEGMSDEIGAVTPGWVVTNTSFVPLSIGNAGLTPFATMDFGSLPIESPTFTFLPSGLSGYTLNPGESIGALLGQLHLDFTPPLPIPTYELGNYYLFEFSGDYIPGTGTGYLTFGFGSVYVDDVPIIFEVVSKPFAIPPDACITGTFPSIPEPATVLLLGVGSLALLRRRRR